MKSIIRPAVVLFVVMTVITGIVYPFAVTAIAQLFFPVQAGGSILIQDGHAVGSTLIGQPFSDPKYFWSRLSATTPQPYNGTGSTGSNLGPLNPALIDAVKSRIDALHTVDRGNTAPIPVDLVTASGSGLDPEISLAAAYYQVPRVARARQVSPEYVQRLVASHERQRVLGFLGEPRVNVLELNLALDHGK